MSAVLTIDQWQIRFYEAMAAVLRAKEAVSRQIGFWGVLNGLWRCSRELKAVNATMKVLLELPDGQISDDAVRTFATQLRKLMIGIEELVDTAKSRGLTNRSLTASVIESIRCAGETTADHLESLQMTMDPEILRAIQQGREQIESGSFETMESLF